MPTLALARNAMNSRFEILLNGENEISLRAAAEEALEEIEKLHAQLSLYTATSELSQINARAAREPVRIEPLLFRLLQRAQQIHRETGGAFDITIAPLMRAWGFVRNTGKLPDPAELAAARNCVGMSLVHLDERDFTVSFVRPGVVLDLGAIGKGYALERAERTLREAGITSALLHGGTSSVCAIGRDASDQPWRIAIEHPQRALAAAKLKGSASQTPTANQEALAVITLENESLSVSAAWGKAFEANGKIFGHILDPRTGAPAQGSILSAVVLPSATDADALSTALLTLGPRGMETIATLQSARTLVASPDDSAVGFSIAASGISASVV